MSQVNHLHLPNLFFKINFNLKAVLTKRARGPTSEYCKLHVITWLRSRHTISEQERLYDRMDMSEQTGTMRHG